MHPSYDHRIFDYDIALLRLSTPLPGYNETMSPICLPTASSNFPPGTNCSVTGWGRTHQSGWTSNKLRVARVPIIEHARCKQQYLESTGDTVTDRMICAGYEQGKIDSCKGDSGGPFVCLERGRYVLVGATSWGVGCAQAGRPGVYTDIKDFLPWIQGVISPEEPWKFHARTFSRQYRMALINFRKHIHVHFFRVNCTIFLHDKAIFFGVSKVIRNCIGFALLSSVIGPVNPRQSIYQPIRCTEKPITTF